MRALLKALLVVAGAAIVTRLAAVVVSKQFEEGSEVSISSTSDSMSVRSLWPMPAGSFSTRGLCGSSKLLT